MGMAWLLIEAASVNISYKTDQITLCNVKGVADSKNW